MARLKGQTKAQVRREMIQPPDFMPTVLEFLGKPVPKSVQGASMLPLLRGRKRTWRKESVCATHGSSAQISDHRWLYGAWVHDHPPKLYDRKTDPDQKRDVLKKNPTVARRLHRKLVAELERLGSPREFIEIIASKLGK